MDETYVTIRPSPCVVEGRDLPISRARYSRRLRGEEYEDMEIPSATNATRFFSPASRRILPDSPRIACTPTSTCSTIPSAGKAYISPD